jgi:hypothetical protein
MLMVGLNKNDPANSELMFHLAIWPHRLYSGGDVAVENALLVVREAMSISLGIMRVSDRSPVLAQ